MKILLDHNIPHSLRGEFPEDCEVYTAQYFGWADYDDDELLEAAVKAAFSVFITLDRNLSHQQDLDEYDIGVVILDVHPATPSHLRKHWSRVLEALPQAQSEKETIVL